MKEKSKPKISTLAELKKSGYQSRGIKQEIRENLILAFSEKSNPFEGIHGFDDSVIPELQSALLAKHNILFLGLRGQAKTRIARMITGLMDPYIPYIKGSEIFEDPFHPITRASIDLIKEKGDETEIEWLEAEKRYTEKLATPDVTVADLIGDLDPIKAANKKLDYGDERVIHFGLIPRSHRGIFVINELPDLQARIQVALFNILQEGDVQIRGFKLRLPLDILFVFTANPEDYTNRGSIVTPLKDRIDSQILTHYPRELDVAMRITEQEAIMDPLQQKNIQVPDLLKRLVERVAFVARQSELIDQKSGVSARLTIAALENLVSTAERRALLSGQKSTVARVSDLQGILPAITGKVELVYEGELEGAATVAQNLISKAIREEFLALFPDPEKLKRLKQTNPYQQSIAWFSEGNSIDLLFDHDDKSFSRILSAIPGLERVLNAYVRDLPKEHKPVYLEFLLYGLAECSQLSRHKVEKSVQFKDLMSGMFNFSSGEEN